MDTRRKRLAIVHAQMEEAVTLLLSGAHMQAEAIIMALANDEREIRKERPSRWQWWKKKKNKQPRSMTKLL